MDVGDVWRVTAKLAGPGGQSIQNVYHFLQVTGVEVDDLAAMEDLAGILDDLYTDLEAFFPATVVADEIDFFDVGNNAPVGSLNWPTFVGGTNVGEDEPPACSALVVLRTGQNRIIGRKYFGPLADGVVSGGEVEAGSLIELAGALSRLVGYIAGGGGLNGYWAGVVKTLGGFAEFIEVVARPIIAYQRRRKQDRGV